MQAVEYLFVYGTLCRQADGGLHSLFADDAEFAGAAELPGKLYEIDGYPGAVTMPEGECRIYGELYRLLRPELLLQRLDGYEECDDRFPLPHEYRRSVEIIRTAAGAEVQAWVYLYNHSLAGRRLIVSGDYRLFRQRDFRA